MQNNKNRNNYDGLRALLARLLELLGFVDKLEKEKLEIELLESDAGFANMKDAYEIAQRALESLDARVKANRVIHEEAKKLHARARAINKMFG